MKAHRTEHERTTALHLARAFLREASRMLLRPINKWRGTSERSREQYVARSAAGVEREQARQEFENEKRPDKI